MGNVLQTVGQRTDLSDEEDLQYLCLQNSSIFNDSYVSEIFENLPEFDGTILPDDAGESKSSPSALERKVKRLVQIFSTQEKKITSVEDFPTLSGDAELENSAFFVLNKMRSRLVQRIHLAYLRQVEDSQANISRETSNIGNHILAIRKKEQDVSQDAILTATSIRMSLGILQCLGPTNPSLFRTVSESIIELLASCTNMALCVIEDGSPQAHALQSITKFASKAAAAGSDNRGDALSLMLAISVTTGSLRDLLSVVNHLLDGLDPIPESSRFFLTRLAENINPLHLAIPNSDTICGDFLAKSSIDIEKSKAESYQSEFCVDGSYLFVWNGLDASIRKIGTGFHGTIAGNEYAFNNNVIQQLKSYLGVYVHEISLEKFSCDVNTTHNSEVVSDINTMPPFRGLGRLIITHEDALIFHVEEYLDSDESLEDALLNEMDNFESSSRLNNEEGTEYDILEQRTLDVDHTSVVFYRVGDYDWIPGSLNVHVDGYDEYNSADSSDEGDSYSTFRSMVDIVELYDSNTRSDNYSSLGIDNGTDGYSGSSSSIFYQGWLVHVNCKLYLRLMNVLGPFRVAVFSSSALKLEGVLDIDIPLPDFISAKISWQQRKYKEVIDMRDTINEDNLEEKAKFAKYSDILHSELSLNSIDKEGSGNFLEEFEYGSEVSDLLHAPYAATSRQAIICMTSTNFSPTNNAEISNLVATDSNCTDNIAFTFSGGDCDQWIDVDLGELTRVTSIGSLFSVEGDNAVESNFTVMVSQDGSSYVKFGEAEPSSFMRNTPVVLRRKSDVDSDTIESFPDEIRYIRFKYGEHCSSGMGSSVSRVMVNGYRKKKKDKKAPFLAMTSDGYHLLFLYHQEMGSIINEEAKKQHVLHSFLLDPSSQLSLVNTSVNDLGEIGSEMKLNKCSFIFNSSFLIISQPKERTRTSRNSKKEFQFLFHKLDRSSGKITSTAENTFHSNKGLPSSVSYDDRNNMIWGWDAETLKFVRWRNIGFPPFFLGAKPTAAVEMMLSQYPQHRIEALASCPSLTTDPTVEAALILSQLDRLSLPYSPPVMPRADSKALNEIEVSSGGYDDGNFGRILIRGQHCCSCSRGFNMLTLDSQFQPKDFRNFDTHNASEASERMADFIDAVPDGTIVLCCVMDSAVQHLTQRGKVALSLIGAKSIDKLGYRGSFAIIGTKGCETDNAKQKIAARRSGYAVVRQRIPSVKAPLCYECDPSVFRTLAALIEKYHDKLRLEVCSRFDKVILISAMRLLMTNVFQLLQGVTVPDALEIFNMSDRSTIVRIVNDLIGHPAKCEGGYVISEIALRLLVNSIDILYPTSDEKCSLLVGYLDSFVKDRISEMGRTVLELLLRQMSTPTSVMKLFSVSESLDAARVDPMKLIHSLLSIDKKETLQQLNRRAGILSPLVTSDAPTTLASVGEASVQMLAIVCNMLLSQATEKIVSFIPTPNEGEESKEDSVTLEEAEAQRKFQEACQTVKSLLTNFMDAGASTLQHGKLINGRLPPCNMNKPTSHGDTERVLDDEIDDIMKNSSVGALVPMILNTTGLLFESHGQRMITHFAPDTPTEEMKECLSAMKGVLLSIPHERLYPKGTGESTGTRSSIHIYESEHPYQANVDEITEVNFPNAIRMTFTFDEQTRTEHNYDWLKIWKDSSKSESLLPPSIEKLTGRNGSENWPGFGGRPPLVIEGGQACLEFHSDSSNEDWGYRVSVQVDYKRKAEVRRHWLMELENQMMYCGSMISSSMIVSTPWVSDKEDRNACWMENSLLRSGFRGESDDSTLSEEDENQMIFLLDFVERPEGSLASNLCKVMKSKVIEDKGQVDDINRAVYATCAALILHKNIVAEAMSVASGTVAEPSESLIRAWRTGQKMRTFFDFGDLKNASADAVPDDYDDLLPPPAMERGPSIYSGAESLVIQEAADRVITRAKFLLRVNSAVKTAELAKESANRKWKAASKMAFHHQQSKKKVEVGWDNLVGELHSAYRLKGMLDYRRSSLERLKSGNLTTSEKVLRFVQGFAVVEDLEHVGNLRNIRAYTRAKGFDMISTLVDSAATPFAMKWLMLSFSQAMRATCYANRPHQHVHYLNNIEGCSETGRSTVIRSFCGFVEKCVYVMNKSYEMSRDEQLNALVKEQWKQVTISCLRALAMDYDLLDHALLDKSNILGAVQFFLQVSDDPDIYCTALSLFELLLPRCVGLEGQISSINNMHEPSELSKKLVALLVSELDRCSHKVVTRSQPWLENNFAISLGSVNLLSRTLQLRNDCVGYTAPHIEIGLNHSITFWFKRHRYSVDTLYECSKPLSSTQLIGCSVIQGPDWNPLHLENGNEDNIGMIMSYDEEAMTVKVRWANNKNTGTYKFGQEEDLVSKYEVVLADRNICGHIYSKGMRALLSEEDRAYVWSTFGLQLTADARLLMFATKDEDGNFRAKSLNQIPPDEWTHISVVQDVKLARLFINGKLDSEKLIPPSMLYPIKGIKEKEIVESPHPYLDNTTSYTEVAIEGAISYTITFDPRTRTEQGHDYIRFYKDSTHSDYWGCDKYTGGRSGSRSNWPGFNDHPPLIIPASKFVVYFKSDGSNNDWGYRIICVAEKNNEHDETKPMIENLNSMPFYIGQTPTYVDNLPSTPSAAGYIADFNVFGMKSLNESEIRQVMSVPCVDSKNGIDDEAACLDILGIMTKSRMSLTGFTSSLLKNAFVGPNILYPLFNILANGTGHARMSCVRVCASLLPSYPVDMIDVQARRLGLVRNDSFLSYLFDQVGAVKNAYYSRSIENEHSPPKLRFCNELTFAIGLEYLNLLNVLITSDLWIEAIRAVIENVLDYIAPRVLEGLSRQIAQETSLGFSSSFIGVDSHDLNMLLVVLGLCGGGLSGLYMGSKARCIIGDDNGIIEDCTILNASWPPSKEELEAMSMDKSIPKSDIDMWKDKNSFTDAFYVVLKSEPTKPLLVPRDKVNIEKGSVAPAFGSLISELYEKFVRLFETLSAINCTDLRPKHIPKIIAADEVKEFESDHPYLVDTNKTTVIEFPGATSISISFDRSTRTEPNTSFLTFYKDETKSESWGEPHYSGRDANQNWPGLGGREPLVIPANRCILDFRSEGFSNDWGYKVIAKAHCVNRIDPPERPPLLHNAVAGHVKLLGMTALHALLKEFPWISLHCIPLLDNLVDSALAPLPAMKLATTHVKPVILESKHPYDHNMDEYTTVRVQGAKKVKVVFDEQTCTENGADYLRFYKDDSHSECWGENQYTGGKDGGSSNWPGMQGRAPLIIPTNTFVVYFKTDGSVNAWGYKIYITSVDDDSNSVPNMDSTLCSFRAHCNHMVIRDCRLSQAEPEGLEFFDTVDACTLESQNQPVLSSSDDNFATLMEKWKLELETSQRSSKDIKGNQYRCSRWPQRFLANKLDATNIIVYEEPNVSSGVVVDADLNCIFVADAEEGDWLHIETQNPQTEKNLDSALPLSRENSPYISELKLGKAGWILRRQGDMIFVIPECSAETHADCALSARSDWINLDEVLSSNNGSTSANIEKHPMYDVEESTLSDVYGTNHAQPTPLEVLQTETWSPERSAADMAQLGSIALSQDCISEILSLWPKDMPFSLECFGSIDNLMRYMRAAYMRDIGSGNAIGCRGSRLDDLKVHILTAIRQAEEAKSDKVSDGDFPRCNKETSSLCDKLMNFAIKEITASLLHEKSLRPTMGKLFVIECKHPYDDNMDEYWDIHIPVAKSLKIVFDSRTSTERDHDYVSIHSDRNKTITYGQRFTGRKRSSDKVWPGLGSVQPLVIRGDKCVVYFHSDSSNTDWGFKLKCYGVMEEPTDEEREAYKKQRQSLNRPFADLACWTLEFLAKEPFLDVYKNLYSPASLATLRRYVEIMPNEKKCFAIQLLTNMMQEIPSMPLKGIDINEEVLLLKNVIESFATSQFNAERSGSSSNSNISQLLQALIQCALVLDNCLTFMTPDTDHALRKDFNVVNANICVSFLEENYSLFNGFSMSQFRWAETGMSDKICIGEGGKSITCVEEACDGDDFTVYSGQGFSKGGSLQFHIKVDSVGTTSNMQIGISGQLGVQPLLSVGILKNGSLTVTLGEHAANIQQFGVELMTGDVITLEMDFDAKSITYHCNHALVGIALGPIGSGAAYEYLEGNAVLFEKPLYLRACLHQLGDSLVILDDIPPVLAPIKSSSASVKNVECPPWLAPIREAVTLLKSCHARELPTAVLIREFLPACEESCSCILQSSHPFDGKSVSENVFIPYAESLTVSFHSSTCMGGGDVIVIEDGDEFGEGGMATRFEYVGLSSGTTAGDSVINNIGVGDKVVRGAAWDWGNQDGGPGRMGEVMELTTWKGKHNAGVTVKWSHNSGFIGLYRWDFEGLYDLTVVSRSGKNMKPPVIPGNSLKLEVIPEKLRRPVADFSDVHWKGALYFNGKTSFLQPPLGNESFDMASDLTVEAWVKVATNLTPAERCLPIFSRHIEVDVNENIAQFSLQLGTSDGEIDTTVLVMEAANTQMQTSFRLHGGEVTPGVWTHVCGVVAGSMTALLVNGSLVATSNSFTGTRLGALGAPLYIGKAADHNFFKGNLFDIRIWNVGRPIAQIKETKDIPMRHRGAPLSAAFVCGLGCDETDIIAHGQDGLMADVVEHNAPTFLCDVMWDSDVEPNILPVDSNFGFQCTIKPTFSLQTVMTEPTFAKKLAKLQCQYTVGEIRHDLALVRYINRVTRNRKLSIDQLLRCEWEDIAPTDDELTAMPLLKELMNMKIDATVQQLHEANNRAVSMKNVDDVEFDGGGYEEMKGCAAKEIEKLSVEKSFETDKQPDEGINIQPVVARFNVLKMLNKALSETMQYFDLCMMDKIWSVAHLLTACRGLIFEVTKAPIWLNALNSTSTNSSSKFDMRLSRSLASKFKRSGLPDDDARHMVFSQAFRQMQSVPPSALRRSDQLFYTTFAGERAHDAGGPYREAFAMMYLELQSPSLPLLIKTPNGRHSVGQNREKWILNPSATSSLHMDMFSFLGKLMGIAIRSEEYMELNIASIIWKLLVHEVPAREDLEAIDLFQIQSLDNMRNIHLQGITRESFANTFYETFTTMSSDNRVVELVTGGEEQNVDFDNRNYYCDLIEQYRFHEFDKQAAAVRRGLATIIPHRLLSLYTWDQLEVMVCGNATIDLNLLKSVTEYCSCSPTDTHIQYFWQIMTDFTEEERSSFLRFVWGRSRLPLTSQGFTQRFKLQSFGKTPADQYLPVAHTCFFSLEFPSYSSLEVAKEKLRYAIHNCQAIDGDDTSVGMQAAALGWED